MLTVEATIRSIITDPDVTDGLLISFFELAAYYKANGAVAANLRMLKPGARLRFTHDHNCRIDSVAAYH